MKNVVVLLCAVTLLIGLGNAPVFGYSSDLIDRGQNTFDSATGLEWLDLNETNRMSYNDVMASDWVVQDGYRMVTANELLDFFRKLDLPSNTTDPADKALFDAVFDLVGWNWDRYNDSGGYVLSHFRGIGWAPVLVGENLYIERSYTINATHIAGDSWEIYDASADVTDMLLPINKEQAMNGYSWVIVREAPIPEPSTILLLSVGLLGLVGLGRKKLT